MVYASPNVKIYGNEVTNCMNGITARQDERGYSKKTGVPYRVRNLHVYNNTITQGTGTAAGISKSDDFDNSVYTNWNNIYETNTYKLVYPNGESYHWMKNYISRTKWQAYGNDTGGRWLSNNTSMTPPKSVRIVK
jgi:hypothetical protein